MKSFKLDTLVKFFEKNKKVSLRGRLTYQRGPFFDLEGEMESLQIYVPKNLQKKYNDILSSNNIIKVKGETNLSKQSKPYIHVSELELITKSGFDLKERSQNSKLNPFVEAIHNRDKRKIMLESNEILSNIKSYLTSESFKEVNTNIIQSTEVGINSKKFNISEKEWMRNDFDIETRLFLLNLERVFQIGKIFRNQGVSSKNKNEFTFAHIFGISDNIENSYTITQGILSSSGIDEQIKIINFHDYLFSNKKYEKVDLKDSKEYFLREIANLEKIELDMKYIKNKNWNLRNLYREKIKSSISNLSLVVGFPSQLLPFAKDIGNGYSYDYRFLSNKSNLIHASQEENDYEKLIQKYKLKNELKRLTEGEKIYLESIKYGVSPFFGIGVGIDLLIKHKFKLNDVKKVYPKIL